MSAAHLPEELATLFWDIELSALDLKKHKTFIIERVLNMGDEAALKWLWREYGSGAIYSTVTGSSRLTLKTARCWQNYFDLKEEQMRCFSIFWASPDSIS